MLFLVGGRALVVLMVGKVRCFGPKLYGVVKAVFLRIVAVLRR